MKRNVRQSPGRLLKQYYAEEVNEVARELEVSVCSAAPRARRDYSAVLSVSSAAAVALFAVGIAVFGWSAGPLGSAVARADERNDISSHVGEVLVATGNYFLKNIEKGEN